MFAILHKADVILDGGPLSDLDVVVDAAPLDTIARLAPGLRALGLHVISLWPYDSTGLSAFICNEDASEGAQLDMTFDPTGAGKYGFRSTALLERRVTDSRWPTLDATDELLYLVRKRQYKGDLEALVKLSAGERFSQASLRRRTDELFSAATRPMVHAALRGDEPPRAAITELERRVRSIPRYASRARRPIGFWAELASTNEALELGTALAARFGRILDRARVETRPESVGAGLRWYAREVAPVRWRAGLFVSIANGTTWPNADIRLQADDLDHAARAIVRAMTVQRAAIAS